MLLFMLKSHLSPQQGDDCRYLAYRIWSMAFYPLRRILSRLVALPWLDGWHKLHFTRCSTLASMHTMFALLKSNAVSRTVEISQRSGWIESESDRIVVSAEARCG